MKAVFLALSFMGALSACVTTRPGESELIGDYSILEGDIAGLTLRADHRFVSTSADGSHRIVEDDGSVIGTATAFILDEGTWRLEGEAIVLQPDDRARKERSFSVVHDSHGILIRADRFAARKIKEPNQALEPTPLAVTPRADARVAPSSVVAHL